MLGKDEPFRVHLRTDQSGTLVVRFVVHRGAGVLGLRRGGRSQPEPSTHYEEQNIQTEALRAGRFVHVLSSGQRQSYALSRIPSDLAARLGGADWTELRPVTEQGFRYLLVPDEALSQRGDAGQAPAGARPGPRTDTRLAHGRRSARPPAARSGSPGAAEGQSLPPRQVPVEPALAEAAIQSLTREQAMQYLRHEMAKVEALHRRIEQLEQELRGSRAREDDLLEVLKRWRDR